MNDCLTYRAAVQLSAKESQFLNRSVGRYVFPNEVSIQTQVRALAIEWSPNIEPGPMELAFQVKGHLCWLTMPNAYSLPQVQELLDNIPWSTLDDNLKLVTLQVAFQGIFSCLDRWGVELVAAQPTQESKETTWTLRLTIEWLAGENTELFLVIHSDALEWLSGQLSCFLKQPSQDLGWLPLQADIACGTTQLSLEEIEHLSSGDQVLFVPCGDCLEEQMSNTAVGAEEADSSCHLVFRQANLVVPGHLRAGMVHRSSRVGHQLVVEEPFGSSPEFAEVCPSKLPLNIVVGTVECTIDEALYSLLPLAVRQTDNGLPQLQYASKVIAHGRYNTILDRPAFAVS